MEKISREQLDLALDSLRTQRTDDREIGRLYPMAFCYVGCPPPVCRWERIPGDHICAKCGKIFGASEKIAERYARVRWSNDGLRVDPRDVEEVLKAYRSCRKAGYDVEMDMHCSKCAKEYDLELAVFKFRAPGENDHVISFPLFRSGIWFGMERPSDKHFYSWQYTVITKFLTGAVKETSDQEHMWHRWVSHMAKTIHLCKSDPWESVEESIEGILGLSFKGSMHDASYEIYE
jgi:DNA-directed RNA polymerase subunit RPC12/RpoP